MKAVIGYLTMNVYYGPAAVGMGLAAKGRCQPEPDFRD
jgi:hypothetical protein